MEIISGIYAIINKVNNKIYIGSSKNIYNRKAQHYSELRGNYHDNIFLQRSWNKYGENSFEFKIIEIVKNSEDLLKVEQRYIDKYYDGGKNCYNMNPNAILPPTSSKKCAIYALDGNLIKVFNSIRDSCNYIGITSNIRVSEITTNKYYLIGNKYRLCLVDKDEIIQKIDKYIPLNYKEIYLIDSKDNTKIIKTFYSISEVCIYFHGKRDRAKETTISNYLTFIYKYNKEKIIYKEDFNKFNGYFEANLKNYKYILKYNVKGQLLEVIKNSYGLKFLGTKADNCKLNTRIRLFGKDIKYRVLDNKFIYFRNNEIIKDIKTKISLYYVEDTINKFTLEFNSKKDLQKYLNVTKGIIDYYEKSNLLYDNKYKIYRITY